MADFLRVAVRGSCGVRDVTLHVSPDQTTVAEVAEVLGFQPGPLLIDGRRMPGSATLDEARMWNGAELAAPHALSPHDSEPFDTVAAEGRPVVALDQIAGLAGGASIPLSAGQFVFGPTGLEPGEPSVVAFGLQVTVSGDITVFPGRVPTKVDGLLLEKPMPLGSLVIDTGAARFQVIAVPDHNRRTPNTPAFHRSPRKHVPLPSGEVAIPDSPKAVAEPPRLSWIAMLAPLPIAALMVLVIGNPNFALFAAMSPIMILGRWVEGKRFHRKETKRWQEEVQVAAAAIEEDVWTAREAIAQHLRAVNPNVTQLLRRALSAEPTLWERRPGHSDFGKLSVGTADIPWHPEASLEKRAPEEFHQAIQTASGLASVPVLADLAEGPLGISGTRPQRLAAAQALISSIAALSGPSDMPVTIVTTQECVSDWDWAKWLPHLGTLQRVAVDPSDISSLVDQMKRVPVPKHRVGDADPAPLPVFVIDGVSALRQTGSPLRRSLFEDTGITAIVLAEDEEDLPASCAWLLRIDSAGVACFTEVADGSQQDDVTPAGCTTNVALQMARAVSWMQDPDGIGVTADLPGSVGLGDIIGSVDAGALLSRWESAGSDPHPQALVGVGPAGPLGLDLVADGPHGLLAGTTGAGKSEFLRTFVSSLAAGYSPDHINFVLIDYKGGGAFDASARLPHTVAMVTDLDGHLGARALRSLQAELKFREIRFRQAEAQDLSAYRATGAVMPRLVVVVDEFATLASELPDFLDALVDIAQRGRSLGIHMILATQRPAGVLDNKIKANTNLRIALRVQDEADSTDVIGMDLAAKLRREDVGRGYVRLGASDVIPFQAAYVGGHTIADGTASGLTVLPFRLSAMGDASNRVSVAVGDETDLERIVHESSLAFSKGSFYEPRRPWLPELPPTVAAETLLAEASPSKRWAAPIALVDVPSQQRQDALWFDAAEGNALIYGADAPVTAGTIATIGLGIAHLHDPSDLHVYVVDTGSAHLRALKDLPHAGAYVSVDDTDHLGRLMDVLERSMDLRKSNRSAGHDLAEPRILLLIEGMGTLLESLADSGAHDFSTRLNNILRDGPNLGITTVGSAAHDRGIPSRLSNQVSVKLLHRLADPSGYITFGLRPREIPKLAGSSFVDVRTGLDGVVAQFAGGDLATAVADLPVPAFIERPPATIRVVPDLVRAEHLGIEPTIAGSRLSLPIGLDAQTVEPVSLIVEDRAAVFGPPASGRSSVLLQLATQAIRAGVGEAVVVVADHCSPLASGITGASVLSLDPSAVDVEGVNLSAASLVIVDDAERVGDSLAVALAGYAAETGRGTWMVIGTRQDSVKAFGSWLGAFRGVSAGLVLQPQPGDGDVVKAVLPLRKAKKFPTGRGYLAINGMPQLIQAAH